MNTNLKTDQTISGISIPEHYRPDDSEENKVIYAFSLIDEGSAEDVAIKISELDKSIEPGGFSHAAGPVLKRLCERGLVSCRTGKDNLGYYFITEHE
jgi:hypothetical protein